MVTRIDHNQLVGVVQYLPYVTALDPSKTRGYCHGWVMGGKCLRLAVWEFKRSTSKGPGRAKSGRFCDYHLLKSCIHYSKFETARADRAVAKNMPKEF